MKSFTLRLMATVLIFAALTGCQTYRPSASFRVDPFSDRLDELAVSRNNAKDWMIGLGIGLVSTAVGGMIVANAGYNGDLDRDTSVAIALSAFGVSIAAGIGEVAAIGTYIGHSEEYYDTLRLQFQYYNIVDQ